MIKQFFISGLAFATALSASGQFNPGDLAVLRLGGGAETLGTAGNTISILDFSTAGGAPVYTLAIPNATLVGSGTSTSEGALALSGNGLYLTMAGYRGVTLPFVGTGGLPATSAATVNRGVAQVDQSGTVTAPAFTTTRTGGSATVAGNPAAR